MLIYHGMQHFLWTNRRLYNLWVRWHLNAHPDDDPNLIVCSFFTVTSGTRMMAKRRKDENKNFMRDPINNKILTEMVQQKCETYDTEYRLVDVDDVKQLAVPIEIINNNNNNNCNIESSKPATVNTL
eukprot:23386_1